MSHVSFDGQNKIIQINDGIMEIDVQSHIYSEWKVWASTDNNLKWEQALTTVGGESLPGGAEVPSFYFLLNGWKVRSYPGTSVINIATNLFVDDGSSPYISGGMLTSISAATTVGVSLAGVTSITAQDLLAIANAVWDQQVNLNQTTGSFGYSVSTIESATSGSLTFDEIIEGSYTFKDTIKLMAASLLGKVSITGDTYVFRNMTDTGDFITAEVDSDGRRLTVTLTPS